jgi:SAM-dependent methyltransferase
MARATIYGEGLAGLYDLFHRSKPYRAEARFIRDAVVEMRGRSGRTLKLLDLACGSGSHAVEFSRLGFDVTGVDSSPEMLAYARRKARTARRSIRFEHQDLTRLSLRGETWDVATCLFDSIGYLRADLRIRRALGRISTALVPGGILFLEVWHAPAMLEEFDPVRIRRVRTDRIEGVRIAETRLRKRGNVAEVSYEIFSRKRGGAWHRFHEKHVNRFFTATEISDLVEGSGFRIKRILGGYDNASKPARRAWHLVVVAERIAPNNESKTPRLKSKVFG